VFFPRTFLFLSRRSPRISRSESRMAVCFPSSPFSDPPFLSLVDAKASPVRGTPTEGSLWSFPKASSVFVYQSPRAWVIVHKAGKTSFPSPVPFPKSLLVLGVTTAHQSRIHSRGIHSWYRVSSYQSPQWALLRGPK